MTLWSTNRPRKLRDQGLRFDSLEQKSTQKSEGPGLAILLFGAKTGPQILGTRACDVTLWSKIEPKVLGTRACDLTLWSKNWAQNLRDKGLRCHSLEQKMNPKTGPQILGTRACDLTLWNLRDQGLRFDSLEQKLGPKS